MITCCFRCDDAFLEVNLCLFQFHCVKRYSCHSFEGTSFLRGNLAGDSVGNGQRPQCKSIGIPERNPCIKFDVIETSYHWTASESIIQRSVRNGQNAWLPDCMI